MVNLLDVQEIMKSLNFVEVKDKGVVIEIKNFTKLRVHGS